MLSEQQTEILRFFPIILETEPLEIVYYYDYAVNGSRKHQMALVVIYLFGLLKQPQSLEHIKHYAALGWEDASRALETIEKDGMPKDITDEDKHNLTCNIYEMINKTGDKESENVSD